MEMVIGILLLLVFVGIPLLFWFSVYFLPTIVALRRKKHDKTLIIALNVCLGWIGPVWIYTCVCAFLDNPTPPAG